MSPPQNNDAESTKLVPDISRGQGVRGDRARLSDGKPSALSGFSLLVRPCLCARAPCRPHSERSGCSLPQVRPRQLEAGEGARTQPWGIGGWGRGKTRLGRPAWQGGQKGLQKAVLENRAAGPSV